MNGTVEGRWCLFSSGLGDAATFAPLIFLGRWLLNASLAHYCSLAVLVRLNSEL